METIDTQQEKNQNQPAHNNFYSPHSKTLKYTISGLAGLVVLIGVFSLGVNVGFRKAGYTYSWARNYPNNFGMPGKRFLLAPSGGAPFLNAHGLDGSILSIDKSTVTIKDEDGNEKIITILPTTTIRKNFQNIQAQDLKTGEEIVVIGSPNSQGQIEAKFIRALN